MFLRVHDPAEVYRRREAVVLAFLDWAGPKAPKDVTDALCRWVQKLRQDGLRKSLEAARRRDRAGGTLTPLHTG